jgi:hypothetical protein
MLCTATDETGEIATWSVVRCFVRDATDGADKG